jgi:hypothetical protein
MKTQHFGVRNSPSIYSGFDSVLYRNVEAKWYFPRENATSNELETTVSLTGMQDFDLMLADVPGTAFLRTDRDTSKPNLALVPPVPTIDPAQKYS